MVLDSLAKSYRATVLLHHHHNNPVVHVFLRLLARDAEARRSQAQQLLPAGSAKLRVANKWRKTVTMVRNPSVASYKSSPPDEEELEDAKEPAPKTSNHTGPTKRLFPILGNHKKPSRTELMKM